jgi:hypothetical protein
MLGLWFPSVPGIVLFVLQAWEKGWNTVSTEFWLGFKVILGSYGLLFFYCIVRNLYREHVALAARANEAESLLHTLTHIDEPDLSESEGELKSQIKSLQAEIEQLKMSLPDLDLEIKAVAFNTRRDGGSNVFIWSKALLRHPKTMNVEYSMSLTTFGTILSFDSVDDLSEWQGRQKDSPDVYNGFGPFHPLEPMPTKLEAGLYAEGWLHFTSEEVGQDCRTVRLRVTSSAGKKEIDMLDLTFKGTGHDIRRVGNL